MCPFSLCLFRSYFLLKISHVYCKISKYIRNYCVGQFLVGCFYFFSYSTFLSNSKTTFVNSSNLQYKPFTVLSFFILQYYSLFIIISFKYAYTSHHPTLSFWSFLFLNQHQINRLVLWLMTLLCLFRHFNAEPEKKKNRKKLGKKNKTVGMTRTLNDIFLLHLDVIGREVQGKAKKKYFKK